MFEYVCGASGGGVHVNVERIPIADVPVDRDELAIWLHRRFEIKDIALRRYFEGVKTPVFIGNRWNEYATSLSVTLGPALVYGACAHTRAHNAQVP